MPALPPTIPPKDGDFDNWFNNFSTLITAAPATYGLAPSDAVIIASQFSAWHAAYLLVVSHSTRTAMTVSAKNTARVNALAVIRPYGRTISNNAGVTSANKIALGLNPQTSTPTPITAPTTNPTLTVQSASNLAIILRYRDSMASPSVKSKPYGAKSCEIYCTVSATPITDPTLLFFKVSATKSPLTITFGSGDVGKQAYMVARWKTQTGLFGPWGSIINFTVPAAS